MTLPQWVVSTIATLSIITSKTLGYSWLAEFYRGIKSAADHFALKIVGGDLSALEGDHFQAVMTIIGSAKNPILRHSAKPNDYLYVTGHLGGSIAGKHFDFTLAFKEGAWLSQQGCTTSMVDITDGLSKELKYLLSKNTAASIDLNRIPIAEHIQNDPSKNREKHFNTLSVMEKITSSCFQSMLRQTLQHLKQNGSQPFQN